ncbi:K02A2.6-like [Cordylochernes scorpioides]|uniref:K02A2.6-like n=1 Tax=Cordylochernes scorpioides TaxID=51811 RepID=A0ABY6KYP8_9ARAC|nr:K02A2.6-like [Cordylochernes scorpioides]
MKNEGKCEWCGQEQVYGFLNEYQSVFQETEVITEKIKLRVYPEHPRILVLPKRGVSHLCKDVQCELENRVNQDIITKINLDTDWVHSMVIERKKSGIIQICLDPHNSSEIIRSLETLGYELDELSDIIIGKILSDKLDKTTKRSWNMTIDSNHIPSSSELLKFLENNAKALNTS